MRKTFTLFLSCCALYASALDPNHFTLTRITAPYFIVDGNVPTTLTKAYVGFEVKNNSNSGVTYNNLRFTITSINTSVVGQNYSLVSPSNGIVNIGTLAPGQTKACYYYVQYPASTTPQATFNVQLSDATATNKTGSFIIYNRSSISANAGGTATQTFTNQDIIGGLVYDDVTYAVGNVQNGDESDFQVAVSSSFDPTKILLLGTQVTASSVPGIPVGTTDSLYFITGNGTNGATITIRWTFKISATNFTTYLLPCAGATSGSTNYKYALNTNLGQGTPITVSSAANPLLITKTSDKLLYGVSSPAVFTITITNPGLVGVTIDRVTDELPAGFTFVSMDASSQVTAGNSTSIPSAGATGNITFDGGVTSGNTSYWVPAGGSITIVYKATTSPTPAVNLLTTARDYVGITQVGAATNTVSVSNTLPVTLLSFTGIWVNDRVALQWSTAAETNSRSVIIERNTGNDFIAIGELPAAGISFETRYYSFTDIQPAAQNQYRLKLVDTDGRFVYSSILSLNKKGEETLVSFYPNPFTDKVNLQVNTESKQACRILVSDLSGKILLNQSVICQAGSNSIVIDNLKELSSGIYLLQVIMEQGTITKKLIRN
jgi:uncharacterized repeat protein (TIGR01451 family)